MDGIRVDVASDAIHKVRPSTCAAAAITVSVLYTPGDSSRCQLERRQTDVQYRPWFSARFRVRSLPRSCSPWGIRTVSHGPRSAGSEGTSGLQRGGVAGQRFPQKREDLLAQREDGLGRMAPPERREIRDGQERAQFLAPGDEKNLLEPAPPAERRHRLEGIEGGPPALRRLQRTLVSRGDPAEGRTLGAQRDQKVPGDF